MINKKKKIKTKSIIVDKQPVKLAYYVGKYEKCGNYMVAVNIHSNKMIVDNSGVPIPFSKINFSKKCIIS